LAELVAEARSSFLKKRSKKLLSIWLRPLRKSSAKDSRVFWFFFSKKNRFLARGDPGPGASALSRIARRAMACRHA
jgi:hypothetical protein